MNTLGQFFHWGPYGLYATYTLMILAIPIGWMYAYTSVVGKHRDITEPDPMRTKAAWGWAIIVAFLTFIWRHVATTDPFQYIPHDAIYWTLEQLPKIIWAWGDGVIRSTLQYVQSSENSIVLRLLALAFLIVFTPFEYGLGLVGMALAYFGLIIIFVVALILSFGFLVAALTFVPGFFLGLPIVVYFLFVRLPLQVVYRRAIREGRWPTTTELVTALAKGTLSKNDWQSKIMAYKSRKFEANLDKDMERLNRRVR